ncbi:hypothetical protein L6Q79_16195 [bacterium]|nr:hypothetical protein [bacterium]
MDSTTTDKMYLDSVIVIIKHIIIPLVFWIIGIYIDDIRNFLFGGRKYSYLKGTWITEWWQIDSDNKTKLLSSSITITAVYGKILRGYGHSVTYGEFNFKGKIANSAFVAQYTGKSKIAQDRPGVFLLRIDTEQPNVLAGVWAQNKNDIIVRGDTLWRQSQK